MRMRVRTVIANDTCSISCQCRGEIPGSRACRIGQAQGKIGQIFAWLGFVEDQVAWGRQLLLGGENC